MSVLLEFSMFPTDTTESKSEYVGRIISLIDESGVPYQLTPMGTIIETDTLEEAFGIVQRSYALLETDCNRVYSSLKIDIRKKRGNRLMTKIESVEEKVGKRVRK